MKSQNGAAHREVKPTSPTSKSRTQEKRVAAMSQTKSPPNLSLSPPVVKLRYIKHESTSMTSRWENSPVYFPAYNYLPQGTELVGVFCKLTSVQRISLSGIHPICPLQPMCHPVAKISIV